MKILFINLPYYGHVIPTIGLVQELSKRNNQVTYLIPYSWENMIANSGADFQGYSYHPKLSVQIKNAYLAAKHIIDDYDMVIYEQFFFLGKHLAEKHMKPVVRIFTAPATNEKLMQQYINAGGALGIFRHKWIGRFWTKDIIKAIADEIKMQTDCWLDEIVQNPPDMNLVYTLEDYQPYADTFPKDKFYFLGASVYDRHEERCTLSTNGKPVIYISLGTVVKGAVSFFKECIEAFRNEHVTVIISVGKNFDINKLGKAPTNFIIRNSVPQLSVLAITDIFVTHGGMNSISEALTAGVPMVVIPFMADQPINAKQITKLGLGRHLEYKKADRHTLRDIVLSILKDETIKHNIEKMRNKMANCLGNSGGSELIRKYYVQSLVGTEHDRS